MRINVRRRILAIFLTLIMFINSGILIEPAIVNAQEAENVLDSGKNWTLYEDGTLIITGTGTISGNAGYLDYYSKKIKKVTIEEGITIIGAEAFYECTNLKEIQIPDTVTRIGDSAFEACGITDIQLPKNLTHIAYRAFAGTNISNIDIPDGVIRLGEQAFINCKKLTSIKIPSGVTTLEASTFRNCTNLAHVEIPESVTFIESWAFEWCESLLNIVLPKSVEGMGVDVFTGINNLESLYIYNPNCDLKNLSVNGNPIIYGYPNSTAHKFAKGNNRIFRCIEEHAWDEGTIEQIPTEDNDGLITYTCEVCGLCTSELIPKIINVSNAESLTESQWCTVYEKLAWAAQFSKEEFSENECSPADFIMWFLRFMGKLDLYLNEEGIYVVEFDELIELIDNNFAKYDDREIREWFSGLESLERYDSNEDTYYFHMDCGGMAYVTYDSVQRTSDKFVLSGKLHEDGLSENLQFVIGKTSKGYRVIECSVGAAQEEEFIPIYSKTDLNNIRNELSANYILMNDIDFDGEELLEITTDETNESFSGILDGNGYCIKNVKLVSVNGNDVLGLFEYNEGIVKDLHIKNIVLDASKSERGVNMGVFAGINSGEIIDSSCDGVEAIYANPGEEADFSRIGSICGVNNGVISGCYNSNKGSLVGEFLDENFGVIGGIAGYNGGLIKECYNAIDIEIDGFDIGGIVAENRGPVRNCYNKGILIKTKNDGAFAGGIAGICTDGGSVVNCYNSGLLKVTGYGDDVQDKVFYGISREYDEDWKAVETSYYLDRNQKYVYAEDSEEKLSLVKMLDRQSYVGFDFDSIWKMEDSQSCTLPTLIGVPNTLCNNEHEFSYSEESAEGCVNSVYEICSQCSYVKRTEAGSHEYGEWIIENAPTCMTEGIKYRECSSCGRKITERISMLEHVWDIGIVTKEPTDLEEGVYTYTCQTCGETKEEVIDKLSHTHNYSETVIEPTCSGDGYTRYTCKCGDSYVDDKVEAMGHAWDEGVVTEEPTESAEGVRTYTCGTCGEIKTETIEKLEHIHSYSKTVTEPTCTKDGYTTYTCSCGDSYVDDEVSALGHTWNEGVVTKEPTEVEEGVRTYTCETCGEIKTEAIATLDHTHKYTLIETEPTCTEAGYTTHRCNCGDSYIDNEIEALGHSYETDPEWSWSEDYSECDALFTCSVCEETKVVACDVSKEETEESIIYTATCEFNEKNYSDVQEVVIETEELPFTDVEKDKWYYENIKYVYENELMYGTSDTTFAPDDNLTRGQFATILYRIYGEPEVEYEAVFTDVPDGEWYTDGIIWAYQNGIIYGYGDGVFGTNDNITREQFAAMMYRYGEFMGYDMSERAELDQYEDVSEVSSWAEEAVSWAVGAEIIYGYSETTLAPVGEATRAQCAAIIMRFIEHFE